MGKLDVITLCFGKTDFFFPQKKSIKSQTQNSLCPTGNIGISKPSPAHTTSPFSQPSHNPALCKTNESRNDWKGPDENNTHAGDQTEPLAAGDQYQPL